MSRFELAEMPEVKGTIPFRKLVIDGKCQFDDFCEQLRNEGNLYKQLAGIMSTLDQVANLKRLPREKFKDITPWGERIKEFEIKKNDLRCLPHQGGRTHYRDRGKKEKPARRYRPIPVCEETLSEIKIMNMVRREEFLKSPEYWFEDAQNELYRQVVGYKEKKGITQSQLAEELGVSKGYVSQILKGEFNYTLKKLIEISLAIGQIPRIVFTPTGKVIQEDKKPRPQARRSPSQSRRRARATTRNSYP